MDETIGAKHNIGTTHRAVLGWFKKAVAGDELRAAKGLYLRKTAGGAFWAYRYRSPVTGKQVRAHLWADDTRGMLSFPDASLEEATLRAAALRARVAAGVDPVLADEQARLAELAAEESEHIHHERHVDSALPSRDVGEVRERCRSASCLPKLFTHTGLLLSVAGKTHGESSPSVDVSSTSRCSFSTSN